MIQGHGGNLVLAASKAGCRPEEIVDMSSNINPLGMMPGLMEHLRGNLDKVMALPEVDARSSVKGLAALLDVNPDLVLMGTGTTQFIYTVCPALAPKKVLIVGPTYADYASSCSMYGVAMDFFMAKAEDDFEVNCEKLTEQARHADVVFLCNPNNPTGRLIPHEQLVEMCRRVPQTVFVIDESYLPFAPVGEDRGMAQIGLDNVVVLWSVSKIFGIPGLRAGFLIAEQKMLNAFARYMQPWCVNSLAQEAMVYMAEHGTELDAFLQSTRTYLNREMDLLEQRLEKSPLVLYPSVTPYRLIGLPEGLSAERLCDTLVTQKLLIRNCSNFHGLDESFVRIALKKPEVNAMAAELMAAAVGKSS